MKKNAHKREIIKFAALKYTARGALVLSLIALIAVIIFIVARGVRYVNMRLLFGDFDSTYPSIKPALIGTLYLILISIIIAAPIGIGSAVFLTEYTNSKSRLIRVILIGCLIRVNDVGIRRVILSGLARYQ